jgi:dihydropteroate synthase
MIEQIKIGNREFDLRGKTYVMGILNVTPDSFSDGGNYNQVESALKHAEEMISDGADIIDIGGESTRPNYTHISDMEEINRVVPVIRAIKDKFDIPVSIDTYKSQVAKAAILAGADLVNDIWGLKYDKKMAQVIKEFDVAVCIMHNRDNMDYQVFMKDMLKDLTQSIELAQKAGIKANKIMIDPGIGFAKTADMNLETINHLEKLSSFGLPILLGASRKSFMGKVLNLSVTQREEGTIATSVIAAMKGCHFVRVHNVKGNVSALRITEAIRNA